MYMSHQTTRISDLTVAEFQALLAGNQSVEAVKPQKTYVYGLRGIRQLFNVCHATAQKYKDTFLRPAISQNGRKIIVDVDHALQLFAQHR